MKRRSYEVLSLCILIAIGGTASADLIGHWPISEGSGDTTADVSPSGTTGMISNVETGGPGGGSVWVSDPVRGNVLGFGGGADSGWVQAGSIPEMTLEQDFTWAFWANHSAENDQPNNIVLGNRVNAEGVDFAPREFIKFTPTKFEWHSNGNGNDNAEYDDFSEIAGIWTHHAVVKSGADLTYYRNGDVGNTSTITQPLLNPQPFNFGGDLQGADGENWQGMIDDVRIYDNALTAEQVKELVPEPSSAALMIAAIGILLYRRR